MIASVTRMGPSSSKICSSSLRLQEPSSIPQPSRSHLHGHNHSGRLTGPRDPHRNVIVEIEPGVTATADPGLLRAVLENLLGNAWKFTGKTDMAQITVGVHLHLGFRHQLLHSGQWCRFRHGILPISSSLLSSASTVPPSLKEPASGLATVQRVIHRPWRAASGAESAPGKGAKFFLHARQRRETETKVGKRPDMAANQILLVEDNPDDEMLMLDALNRCGPQRARPQSSPATEPKHSTVLHPKDDRTGPSRPPRLVLLDLKTAESQRPRSAAPASELTLEPGTFPSSILTSSSQIERHQKKLRQWR